MAAKRLVLFVEGEGDQQALPILIRHLLTDYQAWNSIFLDAQPFRVDNLGHFLRRDGKECIRLFKAAARTRKNLGGILVLLDGDLDRIKSEPFCAWKAGRYISQFARQAGAGDLFSVASVLMLQEYESWLIGGIDSLQGKTLPDGRLGVRHSTTTIPANPEVAPRNAKGWLGVNMVSGYKATVDQAPLTSLLIEDLNPLRKRGLRSFRRLENALKKLVTAFENGKHFVSPELPNKGMR